MLRTEMETQLKDLHENAGKMLKGLRVEGICVQCFAEIGEQHKRHCCAWKLINWRKKNHDLGLFGQEDK